MGTTSSIMTTSWTTNADAGDAEGRVTAAHKTHILRQRHKKKQTRSPKSWKPVGWCWITSTSSSWRTTAALWVLEWVNTNPLILSKMFGISGYSHHKISHKQFISGEFMCEGGTLLLGEAGVDGRGLPQLQSLLHTFQQAPATGRPGVYLTTGLNGPEQ